MENFTFYSPTKFVFGMDTESQSGSLVKEFGGSKALLHFGGKSAENQGCSTAYENLLQPQV